MPVACSVLGVLPLFLVSAQSVALQRELSFGPAKLGLIVSAFFAASAVAAWPLGHVIERIGSRRGLLVALAGLAVGLALIAGVAGAWWHLAAALALCGAANALVQVSSNSALAAGVALRRQGLAFGAKQAAIPLASLTAGLALPLVALVAGWRVAFAGACVVAAAALAALMCPRHGSGATTESRPAQGAHPAPRFAQAAPAPAQAAPAARSARPAGRARPPRAITARHVLTLLGVAGLLAGTVASSVPAFAVDAAVARGFGDDAAAILLAVGSAIAFVVRLGAGWLVDRRASMAIGELAAFVAAGALAFALLAALGTGQLLFVVGYLAAFATAWGWPGLLHYAAVCVRRDAPAVASGVVLSIVFLGNIIGPTTVGFVVEHGSYSAAWLLCAVVLALGALAAAAAARAAAAAHGVAR